MIRALCALAFVVILFATAACTAGVPVREGWQALPGGDLHWEARGRGPAIVLLHGGGLDLRQWDDEVEWLSQRWMTLRYDQRGHGSSLAATAPYAAHEDLRELLDRHGIGRVVVVAHSNGGRVAVDFALRHPARVAALFLLAPGLSGWEWDEDELAGWLDPILEAVEAGDRERVLELWLASPFLEAARERPDTARELQRLAQDNVEVWFHETLELGLDPPAAEWLSEVAVPTRVLVGTRDLPELLRIAEAVAVHVEDTEVVRLEGVGHLIDMEAPQRVRDELEAFLSQIGW